MKLLNIFIIAIIVFIYSLDSKAENQDNSNSEVKVISLEDAISITLNNNPSLKSVESSFDISKATLSKSISVLYPQIEAKVVIPFIGRESGFFLDQLIWDFGRTTNTIKSNRYYLKSAKYDEKYTRTNLINELKIKYYKALIAKNNLYQSKIMIGKNELLVQKTEELMKVDRKTEFQFAQAQINLQKSKLVHLKNKNIYETSKLELLNIMGDMDLGEFDISDDYTYEQNLLNESEFIKIAILSNSKLKSLEAKEAGIKSREHASKSKFYPTIFGRTAYRFEGEGAETPAFIAGVGIKMPIFQGFSRFADISEAKAKYRKNQAEKEKLKNEIILETKKLFLEIKQLKEEISINNESKIISEKNYELTKEKYKLEIASKIDIAEAEFSKAISDSEYKNSIYNYKITVAKLNKFLGE